MNVPIGKPKRQREGEARRTDTLRVAGTGKPLPKMRKEEKAMRYRTNFKP